MVSPEAAKRTKFEPQGFLRELRGFVGNRIGCPDAWEIKRAAFGRKAAREGLGREASSARRFCYLAGAGAGAGAAWAVGAGSAAVRGRPSSTEKSLISAQTVPTASTSPMKNRIVQNGLSQRRCMK